MSLKKLYECLQNAGVDTSTFDNKAKIWLKEGYTEQAIHEVYYGLFPNEEWKTYYDSIKDEPVEPVEPVIETAVVAEPTKVEPEEKHYNLFRWALEEWYGEAYIEITNTLNEWYLNQPIKKEAYHYIINEYLKPIFDEQMIGDIDRRAQDILVGLIIETPTEATPAAETPMVETPAPELPKELVEESTKELVIPETTTDFGQNVSTITKEEETTVVDTNTKIENLEEEINSKLIELMHHKKEIATDGPYLNDSYKWCPSFKNLIPQIQKVITKKREINILTKWYEKYRPELFEEILFPNKVIKNTISEFVRNGYVNGHCMFYGEGGVGKTTTNIVIMNAILKNASDRFILDRKIESVDNLKGFLAKKPIGRQKIVIAEEFDRLSDAAMTELKNGLLEKYEDTIFLASTNKIHKIDQALLSRFTLVAKFELADPDELFDKCKYILNNERMVYKDEDILSFVEANKLKGIRTILNNLQLSCYDRIFDPNRTSFFIGSSGTEYNLILWVKQYIYYLLNYDLNSLYTMLYSTEQFTEVHQIRAGIMESVLYNYNLNYDYVFIELLKDNSLFLPAKNTIEKYYQDVDIKKIKSMHFEAMLNEITHMVYEFRNIELNWQHKQLTDTSRNT